MHAPELYFIVVDSILVMGGRQSRYAVNARCCSCESKTNNGKSNDKDDQGNNVSSKIIANRNRNRNESEKSSTEEPQNKSQAQVPLTQPNVTQPVSVIQPAPVVQPVQAAPVQVAPPPQPPQPPQAQQPQVVVVQMPANTTQSQPTVSSKKTGDEDEDENPRGGDSKLDQAATGMGMAADAAYVGKAFDLFGGSMPSKKLFILKRWRKVHKIGRYNYVKIKGKLTKISEAKEFEKKQQHKVKHKKSLKIRWHSDFHIR
jgi:hypothetical protein